MASPEVYEVTKSYLQDLFSQAYSILNIDDVDARLQQGKEPFMVLEDAAAEEEMVSFGSVSNRCMRESGSMVVHCFVPSPASSDHARDLARTVQVNLRHKNIGDVRFMDVSPPDIEFANNGLWTSGAVIAYYEYDSKL